MAQAVVLGQGELPLVKLGAFKGPSSSGCERKALKPAAVL